MLRAAISKVGTVIGRAKPGVTAVSQVTTAKKGALSSLDAGREASSTGGAPEMGGFTSTCTMQMPCGSIYSVAWRRVGHEQVATQSVAARALSLSEVTRRTNSERPLARGGPSA